jgi:hypothetical protein
VETDEAPRVFETPGGLSVSYRGRALYSERDPEGMARRIARSCDPGPSRLHLVVSPLLWHGVPELLEAMGEGSSLLCVEAEPRLARLARESAPPGLLGDPRVRFVETASAENLVVEARKLGSFRFCAQVRLTGGCSLHAELYDRMAALLGRDVEDRCRNRASLVALGRLWARNLFDNIAALGDIDPLPMPRFPGAAVLCGAGPSLERALPFIAGNRPYLSVIACDTALGSLLAAGVALDLVVCLESQSHNLSDFVPLGRRPVALAADLSSHPSAFRVEGTRHLSLVRITESPFLDRVAAMLRGLGLPFLEAPPLGSVGVHALRMARLLAAGPVLACGLDFSYEAGKTHARGSPSLLSEGSRLSRLCRWPGQYETSLRQRSAPAPCAVLPDGRSLRSDPVLLAYAALLREVSAEPGGALYDLRGRGPSIGARTVTLDEAARLVRAAAASPVAETPRAPGGDRSQTAPAGALRQGARRFVVDEIGRIDRLRSSLSGERVLERTEFSALLEESDYLLWSFPDSERAAGLPTDLLNRLVPELAYWSSRLRAILEP